MNERRVFSEYNKEHSEKCEERACALSGEVAQEPESCIKAAQAHGERVGPVTTCASDGTTRDMWGILLGGVGHTNRPRVRVNNALPSVDPAEVGAELRS